MRQKIIEKVVSSKVFIAYDGKEFNSWAECAEHEASKRDEVVSNFKKLVVGTASECDIYGTGGSDEGCIVAFIPRSLDDIRSVEGYSLLVNGNLPGDLIENQLYYVYVGYNYETFCPMGTKWDILKRVGMNLEQMLENEHREDEAISQDPTTEPS